MKSNDKHSFSSNGLITLKNNDWLEKQRIAGKVAARTLILLENLVKEKTTKSLLELDKIVNEFIISNGCTPTFLGYKSFPGSCCMSVNRQLVHGIPTNYKLQDGDVISFDLGTTFEKSIADTALTVIYGTPKSEQHIKLIQATEMALMKGIEAIAVGKRLGCIGNAIYRYAKGEGYGVISQYGGHGISWNTPHDLPFVSNKSELNEGIRIQPGLSIAIEPMLTMGSTKTTTDKDGWTVHCDAEMSAHFEHSVYVHEDYVEIITDRNNL